MTFCSNVRINKLYCCCPVIRRAHVYPSGLLSSDGSRSVEILISSLILVDQWSQTLAPLSEVQTKGTLDPGIWANLKTMALNWSHAAAHWHWSWPCSTGEPVASPRIYFYVCVTEPTRPPTPVLLGAGSVEKAITSIMDCNSSLSLTTDSGDFKPVCLPHNWDDDDLLF